MLELFCTTRHRAVWWGYEAVINQWIWYHCIYCIYFCVYWFPQVNGVNVVKVGHKQVVSLIRQGGNSLLMKVVSVTRKPESEDVVRKKGKTSPLLPGKMSCVCCENNRVMWVIVSQHVLCTYTCVISQICLLVILWIFISTSEWVGLGGTTVVVLAFGLKCSTTEVAR